MSVVGFRRMITRLGKPVKMPVHWGVIANHERRRAIDSGAFS